MLAVGGAQNDIENGLLGAELCGSPGFFIKAFMNIIYSLLLFSFHANSIVIILIGSETVLVYIARSGNYCISERPLSLLPR